MRLITYDIHLLEPLLVTALDGDPNSSISYDFIPGSVLRGAIISRYQHQGNEINPIALRSLFFRADTQYLNGYRTVWDKYLKEQVRSLPLPLSLRREETKAEEDDTKKPQPYRVYDFAWTSEEDTEQVTASFGLLDDNEGWTAHIERQMSIHIQRDRRLGRSTRESGEIYNYEALSAGQTFRAHIWTTLDEQAVQPVVDLLAGELHLGGSRSAGYGRVRFELLDNTDQLDEWLAQRCPSQKPSGKITITLLSDLLLRDGNGNWTTDARETAQALGLELDTVFRAARPIGGFNRKWGLPLPQHMALKMGTVLVCQPVSDGQWQKLQDFARDGVGESREDGYGRIAINWQTQSSFLMSKPEAEDSKIVSLPAGSPDRQIASGMVARMMRTQLEQRIIAKANELADKAQIRATPSQIYRLRQTVQTALQHTLQTQQSNVSDLQRYLEDLESRRRTRDQFQKTRVDKKPILKWIGDLLKETTPTLPDFKPVNVQIGDVQAEWSHIMTLEANLRLIDAVLAQMGKKGGG